MATRIGGLQDHRRYFEVPADGEKATLFDCCISGDLYNCKKIIRAKPDLIHSKTEEGENLAVVALRNQKYEIANWIFLRKPELLIEENEQGDTLCFELYKNKMFAELKNVLLFNPKLMRISDKDGNTLFLLACQSGELDLAKFLFSKDRHLLTKENKEDKGALLMTLSAGIVGYGVLVWLVNEVKIHVISQREVKDLIDYSEQVTIFDQRLIVALLNHTSLPYFLPYLDLLKEKFVDEAVLSHVNKYRAQFPRRFSYDHTAKERLQGEALISFYDEKIIDLPSVKDPYKKLTDLFMEIKKTDYLAQMSLGLKDGAVVSDMEAATEKETDARLYTELFTSIKERKPDIAIPQGRELVYYAHLEKILKHLARHLSRVVAINERFTYLKDITSCSGVCYTHYSTIFHSMYVRITGDENVSEAHRKSDIPSIVFFEKLKAFYKTKIEGETIKYIQNQDAHVNALIQRFFRDGRIPYHGENAVDGPDQLASLIDVRTNILQLAVDDPEHAFLYGSDELLYEDTQNRFFEMFTLKIFTTEFFYRNLKEFLLSNLKKEGSGGFLIELSGWLEENHIPTHSLLTYQDDGSYGLKSKGLCELMKKLPRDFSL